MSLKRIVRRIKYVKKKKDNSAYVVGSDTHMQQPKKKDKDFPKTQSQPTQTNTR